MPHSIQVLGLELIPVYRESACRWSCPDLLQERGMADSRTMTSWLLIQCSDHLHILDNWSNYSRSISASSHSIALTTIILAFKSFSFQPLSISLLFCYSYDYTRVTLFANYKLKLINLQSDSRATEHNEKFGVNNGEREERAIMLVWGRAPSSIQGPGQKGQGQSPLKLKGF